MFYEEYTWLKEKIKKHYKKKIFWIWEFIAIIILIKIWKFIIINIFFFHIWILYLFYTDKLRINIYKNKISIAYNYYIINFLKSLEQYSFSINNIIYLLFFYLFRIFFGISYKCIKISISLYDCIYDEYIWANLNEKKKKYWNYKNFYL